jgi:hypothetical protein
MSDSVPHAEQLPEPWNASGTAAGAPEGTADHSILYLLGMCAFDALSLRSLAQNQRAVEAEFCQDRAKTLYAGKPGNDDAAITLSSTTPSSTTPSPTTPSPKTVAPSDSLAQQIDAVFQEFDVVLMALESNLTAMNPQLSSFFVLLNGDLHALEANALSML